MNMIGSIPQKNPFEIATLSWWVLWERVVVMMLRKVIEIIIDQTYTLC